MDKIEQLKNLEIARAAIANFPSTNVNLQLFIDKDAECGTCYCAAGILTTVPEFKDRGLRIFQTAVDNGWNINRADLNFFVRGLVGLTDLTVEQVGALVNDGTTLVGETDRIESEWFGPYSYKQLFQPYNCGGIDDMLIRSLGLNPCSSTATNAEHQKLAVARFDYVIEQHKASM